MIKKTITSSILVLAFAFSLSFVEASEITGTLSSSGVVGTGGSASSGSIAGSVSGGSGGGGGGGGGSSSGSSAGGSSSGSSVSSGGSGGEVLGLSTDNSLYPGLPNTGRAENSEEYFLTLMAFTALLVSSLIALSIKQKIKGN